MIDALEASLCSTFVRTVRQFEELPSTNDYALAIATDLGDDDLPCLVIADLQAAGRGRGSNRWWSTAGALTFSLVIQPGRWGVPSSMWPRLSVAVGGAVAEALSQFVTDGSVRLKWPNDVYLGERKLCGVLVETTPGHSDRLVIGIGVNVGNSFAAAPAEVADRATSLADATGKSIQREEVLIVILRQLDSDLTQLAHLDRALLQRWRRSCFLTGRMVSVSDPETRTFGACLGIEDDASLLIQTEAGPQRRYAGVVEIVD